MNSVMTVYLTDKIACDYITVSTVLAIREVINTKCRYRAPRNIGFCVSRECGSDKIVVKVR